MPPDPVQNLLLKTTQVARLLSMDPSSVRRLVRRGVLKPCERSRGGHARFRYADVQAYRQSLPVWLPAEGEPR